MVVCTEDLAYTPGTQALMCSWGFMQVLTLGLFSKAITESCLRINILVTYPSFTYRKEGEAEEDGDDLLGILIDN